MNTRSLVSLLALAGATLTPLAAHASGEAEASPKGKGVAGGALLGAELVLVTEAAFDVKPAWAYILGGVAGAAAGGVGGYFIEKDADARGPMLMLAGGLVFAIPTTVAVLAATAYEPPANYLQDQAPADEPVAEPPAPRDSTPSPAAQPPADSAPPPAAPPADAPPADAPPAAAPTGPTGANQKRHVRSKKRLSLRLPPPALLGYRESRLALGVPNVEVLHAYTRTERIMFNAPDVTELRIPLLNVLF